MFLDTKTQGVPRFCQNKKVMIFLLGIWVVCLLLYLGVKEEREMSLSLCQYPAAMPCLGWRGWGRGHLGKEYLLHTFLSTSLYKIWKENSVLWLWLSDACQVAHCGLDSEGSMHRAALCGTAESLRFQLRWRKDTHCFHFPRVSAKIFMLPAQSPFEKQGFTTNTYSY